MTPTQTLPRRSMSRKARFRAALGLARMTAGDFARLNKVTAGHLSHVLSGERVSGKLASKIDAFIAKHLGERIEGSAA